MRRIVSPLVLAAALAAPDLPRAAAAAPDVPFLGTRTNPTLADSYMPGRKVNPYAAADWAADAFPLASNFGLPFLQDVGVGYVNNTVPGLDDAGLIAQLMDPANKKTVTVRTKSDSARKFLYVAFEVQDSSRPGVISDNGPLDGDRVMILVDPENNKTPPAAGVPDTRFRLSYQVPRTATQSGRLLWSKRTGAGEFMPLDEATLPADFKVAVASTDVGYSVGLQIPLGMVGLDAKVTEFGLGFAVVNATSNRIGTGMTPDRLSFAVAYPNSDSLYPKTGNLPQNDDDSLGGGWENQANWGTAYLRGDLGTIVIRGGPPQYHSPDIRIGTLAATSFASVNDYSADPITNWYKYKPVAPCPGRFWGQVHRKVQATPDNPAARDVKARILFLWGPAGVPPVELYYIGVSDPFLIRRDTTDREMYQPVVWKRPPTGLGGHPCVVAVVLPEVLDKGTYKQADFDRFQTQVDDPAMNVAYPASPDWAKVRINLTTLQVDYSLTGEQLAQMNIDPKVDFTCPDQKPVDKRPEPEPTPPGIGLGGLSRLFAQPVSFQPDPKNPRDKGAEPPVNPKDVLVDFEAFAIVRPTGANKTAIVEPLGGVRKLVNVEHLKKHEQLDLVFNVTNPRSEPREIVVGYYIHLPPEAKGYRVDLPAVSGTFRPGETRPVTAVLTSRPPAPPPQPSACPPVACPPCQAPQAVCPQWQGPIVIYPCPPERRGLLFRRWR